MARKHEASCEGGAPEYMVSYADMLTIMLAFFIVLYASTGTNSAGAQKGEKAGQTADKQKAAPHSKSGGPKDGAGKRAGGGKDKDDGGAGKLDGAGQTDMQRERFDRVVESLQLRFGPEWTISNCWIGGPPELREIPANRVHKSAGIRNNGRATWGQIGDDTVRARAPKPGENILVGGRIYFDETSSTLNEAQQQKLGGVAEELAGKLQRIDIRGHACRLPLPSDSPFRDHWDLAYARSKAVRDFLISKGIDAHRIRLSVAGENEPLDGDGEVIPVRQNSRVEIHVLNEVVRPSNHAR